MSYQALARKWRPRRFADLVGQEHVLRALVHALDNDRLHHAYLFTGTRGVGKTTIARILAKALNCERGVSSTPCGECGACTDIDAGRFVDLIEVDAASRTKIEDTRDLLDNVQYAPARGRYKVYLIDEVHMLSRHSFNALLKTLEEPPPHVKFLLATTDPQNLPVTVLSRCLQFNLKRLPVAMIRERLRLVADSESWSSRAGPGPAGARRRRQPARCPEPARPGGLARRRPADEQEVAAMLGTVDREHAVRLLEAVVAGDGPRILAEMADSMSVCPDYDDVLGTLAALVQRAAVLQAAPDLDDDEDGLTRAPADRQFGRARGPAALVPDGRRRAARPAAGAVAAGRLRDGAVAHAGLPVCRAAPHPRRGPQGRGRAATKARSHARPVPATGAPAKAAPGSLRGLGADGRVDGPVGRNAPAGAALQLPGRTAGAVVRLVLDPAHEILATSAQQERLREAASEATSASRCAAARLRAGRTRRLPPSASGARRRSASDRRSRDRGGPAGARDAESFRRHGGSRQHPAGGLTGQEEDSMKGQIGQLMRQAQQMQENMEKAQQELARWRSSARRAAAWSRSTMSCRHEVRSVAIDPALLGDDKEMLEDLVAAAVNDALRKVERRCRKNTPA
jgi:DNA polymerase III subunit gamma/tau